MFKSAGPVTPDVVRLRAVGLVLGALAALVLVAGAAAAYVPHAPIKVTKVEDLAQFPGKGTRTQPYFIEGYEIAATESHGISIANTTAHVVVRDVRVANGGTKWDGIVLTAVKNVTVQDVFLEGNRNGVAAARSSSLTFQRLNVNSTSVGILLDQVKLSSVRDSVFPQNERGVLLQLSPSNRFDRNRLTIASGQFGFWFADNMSIESAIDTSNLVNEVPMRWYVNATALTVRDARVDLKGITNVAQMLVFRSDDVRVERAFLTNGSSRGLLVLESEDVVVTGTNASVNEGHGVDVVAGRRVRFLDGDASVNGGDGVRVERPSRFAPSASAANAVGRIVAVGNKGRAVAFTDAGDQGSVFDVVARGNGAGILAQSVGQALSVADNRVTDSSGPGINVSVAGPNASVTGNVVERNRGDGIRMTNVGAGANVRNNEVVANRDRGVYLHRVGTGATVAENHVRSNGKAGVMLSSTWHAQVVENAVERQARNFEILKSSRNSFFRNEIVKAENETGFHFSDEYSYDNPIGPNTTVNGVPVQWRVGLKGTEKAPVVLRDLRVETPNATNVAQIGFHNSSWIVLERPVAANGPAVGLMLFQTHDVRVVEAVARDNAGSGILVRSSSGVHEARAASNVFLDALVTGNGKGPNDAGVKFQGAAAAGNVLKRANVTGNSPAGVRLEQSGARNVLDGNVVRGNAKAGVVLDRATLATVQGNSVGNHSRDVEIAGSVSNLFQGNALEIDNGSYGFYVRDELSYSNDILANTTVNGVGVQWFTFVDGREGAPVVLRPAPVEVRGITNVAQVLVYKSSWVRFEGVVAANGTDRGVFLVQSSQVDLANATARASPVGIELGRTLASRVVDAVVTDDGVGVRLNMSSGNTVARAVAAGSKVAVRLTASENNRVFATNATGAGAVIDDPTFKPGNPNAGKNLLVDAGLDQTGDLDAAVTFGGVVAVSSFRNEPVVMQRWDFGDGATLEIPGGNASRPAHAYGTPGRHVARLTVHTPTATYSDEAVVTVKDPDEGRVRVKISCDPSRLNATVGENVSFSCTARLVAGEAHAFVVSVMEKGDEVANVTVDVVPEENVTFTFGYVPNATGDHLLRVGTSTVVHVDAFDPPPPPSAADRLLAAPAWAAAAALAAAALTRARARRP